MRAKLDIVRNNYTTDNNQANPMITEGIINCKNEDIVNSSIEGTVGSNTENALGFDIVGSNTNNTIDSNTALVESEYAELSHSHLPGHTDVGVSKTNYSTVVPHQTPLVGMTTMLLLNL